LAGLHAQYYDQAFHNSGLQEAFLRSIGIALTSTVLSTAIGALLGWPYTDTVSAEGAVRGSHLPADRDSRDLHGHGHAKLFRRDEYPPRFLTIAISHIAFSFPFVAVVVRSRMSGFDESLEEASRDLGASPWQTFFYVTLPYMTPGIIAGALLAFTLSLDDYVITQFTSGPGSTTFPVKIYSMVRQASRRGQCSLHRAHRLTLTVTIVAMWVQSRSGNKSIAS